MYRSKRGIPDTGRSQAMWMVGSMLACLLAITAPAVASDEAGTAQEREEKQELQQEQEPREKAAPIQRYMESVSELEAEGGAWAPALQQELFGLGLAYQRDGRHAEAVTTLNRAEHLTRINEGLYSSSDLPILERLIESHAALGDWEKVQNRYRQVFLIHQRNYGENDERLLPVLYRLSAWHIRAYLDAIGGEPAQHLLTARNFYDSAITIIETNSGTQDRRIADTLRRRALIDYYVASSMPVIHESFGFGAEPADEAAIQARIANSFAAGRDALRRVVDLRDADVQSNELERSEALAELADWHQLFARRQSALRLYQQAWAQGERSGGEAAQVRDAVFGRPLPLPQLPADFDSVPGSRADTAWIKIRFVVNENGRATDVQVVESSPPATDRNISRLRKRVLSTAFRPRFESGQPVATTNVDYLYSYTP